MNPRDIILAPVITEKAVAAMSGKKYTFKVAKTAGKIEIAKAAEELFGVSVEKVSTVSVRGQMRRMGRNEGYTPSWKKAVITLKPDSKTIEFFNGMF